MSKYLFHLSCLVLITFLISPSFAQNKKDYNSLLWEISGNGLEKPSYLYGTMHVSNKVAFHLPESFFNAIRKSDIVALEINPDIFIDEIYNSPFYSGRLQSYGYVGNFYSNGFYLYAPTNNMIRNLLTREHDFANYLLYRSWKSNEDFEENTYLDLFIYQAGKKLNKKIIGLEILDQTIEFSIRASKKSKQNDSNESEERLVRVRDTEIQDAYRKADLDLLDSLTRVSESKVYREYMLYKRNEIMADRMDSLMKQNTVFTGVGAAHLPGEMGVIALLRKKGYTVKAIINDGSHSRQKEKIEQMEFKNSFMKFSPQDSLFEVSVPGKVYVPTSNMRGSSGGVREYFCADMPNGAHYSIYRINTFASLENRSVDDYFKRIDSMLFENIPGKILKKKIINEDGLTGWEIHNITKTGNEQQTKIYITPVEVIIFQVKGLRNYASGQGSQFINSIRFNSTKLSQVYQSDAGFRITMPGKAIFEDNLKSGLKLRKEFLAQSYDTKNNSYYLLARTSLHDHNYIEEDNFELKQLTKEFCKEFSYTVQKDSFFTFQGMPSVESHAKKTDSSGITIRLIISGDSYYIMVSTAKERDDQKKFFESFNISEKKYRQSFQLQVDSSYHFTVNSPVDYTGKIMVVKDLEDEYEYYRSESIDLTDEKTFLFESKETGEEIKVEYFRLPEYFSVEEKDFESRMLTYLSYGSRLIVSRKERGKDFSEYLISDTNSIRAIRARVVMSGNKLFLITTPIDTLQKRSKFVKEFYESFKSTKPEDNSILKSKSAEFFAQIFVADSSALDSLVENFNYIEFQKGDSKNLLRLLKYPKLYKYFVKKNYLKEKIIQEMVMTAQKEDIANIKELYISSSDSADLQMNILQGLAQQKTQESYSLLKELMNIELPPAENHDVYNLFYSLEDTLKLSVRLFPDLLNFSRYQEYKSSVYSLLAACVDSGLVKKEMYIPNKQEILREASIEVKKANANNDRYSYRSYNTSKLLKDYTILLAPFSEEPLVKKAFSKMLTMKNKEVAMSIALLLQKKKINVPDSIWRAFITNDSYRIYLYKGLKEISQLDKFDKTYLSQVSFCKSHICSRYTSPEKDTVVFLEKRKVIYGKKEGYVYFFKRRKEKEKYWKLEYAGLQPLDSSIISEEYDIIETNYQYSSSELKTKLDEIVDSFVYKGRNRVKGISRKKNLMDYMLQPHTTEKEYEYSSY